jgi:hypothetical protein
MAKRITLRNNTATNTGKGTKMSHAEMDANLETFFISSSLDGTTLYLHSTGSINTDTIDLSGIVGLGAQGPQGANGANGIGTQGVQGTVGTQGLQGLQGTNGTNGTNGSQGTQGLTGSGTQGAEGPQGLTGTGIQGIQGIAGGAAAQGSQGEQGPQGLTGTGTQGVQGLTGTGTQGVQGITGTGTQGSQGEQGPQGLTGTGTQGVQGITGTGTQGAQGITGTGTQGVQGIEGQGITATSLTLGSSSETLGDHTDNNTHAVQTSWTRLAINGGSFTNLSGDTKSYLVVLGLEMTSTYTQSGIVPFGIDIKFADIASGAIVYTEWRDTVFMSYASEVASRVTKTYVSHAFQLDNGEDFAVYVKGTPYLALQLSIQYSLLTVTELTGTAIGTLN